MASGSKFRRQALDLLDLEYDVIPSKVDEKSVRRDEPRVLAKVLAEKKAIDVGSRLDGFIRFKPFDDFYFLSFGGVAEVNFE